YRGRVRGAGGESGGEAGDEAQVILRRVGKGADRPHGPHHTQRSAVRTTASEIENGGHGAVLCQLRGPSVRPAPCPPYAGGEIRWRRGRICAAWRSHWRARPRRRTSTARRSRPHASM